MRFVRTLVLVLASISSLLSARILAAAAAQCTGVVLDENGVPVSAAQIKLEDTSGRAYRTETDGAGRFTIRDLPAGDYKVEVRKERFFLLRGGTLRRDAIPARWIRVGRPCQRRTHGPLQHRCNAGGGSPDRAVRRRLRPLRTEHFESRDSGRR